MILLHLYRFSLERAISMKKIASLLFVSLFLLFSTACGNEPDIKTNPDEEVDPKVAEDNEDNKSEEKDTAEKAEKDEDIWTYYENATAEESWEEMKFKIEKVVVSDKAPKLDENGNEVIGSAVGVKMTVENTSSDKKYTTYPDQATLVTSTGEQVDADLWVSDDVGGDFYEGVVKQGNIIFYLERGNAADITWVKLIWNSSYEDPTGNWENDKHQTHEIKLELK
jgi:hypothetical protein